MSVSVSSAPLISTVSENCLSAIENPAKLSEFLAGRMSQTTRIDDVLPSEVLINIFSQLTARELGKVELVCKRWRSLAWHAWVGVRDIWMDYVKPVGVRLALQVFTIVWLVGCAGWSVQVLWRL